MTERLTVQDIEERADHTREVDLYREVLRTVAMFGDTNSRGLARAALAVWDRRADPSPSRLAAGVTAGDLAIFIDDPTDWPTQDFEIAIDAGLSHEEWVLVRFRDATVLTVATRGVGPTIACAHMSGAAVSLR